MVSSKLCCNMLQLTLVQVCWWFVIHAALRKYCVMCLDLWSFLFIDTPEIIIKQHRNQTHILTFLFVSCQIECVKDVPSLVFVLSHKTNYIHMYEFLWSTAAISASDKTEPKSGNHQMPPTLPLYHIKRQCTQARTARAHRHTDLHTQASAAAPHTKGAHAHTQICAMLFVSANWCRW